MVGGFLFGASLRSPLGVFVMFSVVILALNEESLLPACLESVAACTDIVVIDSGSTDRTVDIARKAGARVIFHPFTSFAQQRSFADQQGELRFPWVFHLDADEQFTPELFAECLAWGDPSTLDGAFVAPRMLFNGKWLRRSTDFPAYQARFVHHERFRWEDLGHGQREAPGQRMGKLKSAYLHHFFATGEQAWLEKHRRYAEKEAAAHLASATMNPRNWRALYDRDPLVRRRALKRLSYSLPARPYARFIYQYVLRGGFMDGAAGWRYCWLLAQYERFAALSLRRLRSAH